MRPVAKLVSVLLAVVAVAHLLRLIFRVEVVGGGHTIPMWVSAVGMLISGGLAAALWGESRR